MKTVISDESPVRALLAAVGEEGDTDTEASLDELERLLETSGGICVARVIQRRGAPDPKTYFGSGKCSEAAEFIRADGDISLVVFDNELSPSQIRNLEDALDCRVIDRTMLILDIFAQRAVTAEGKLQVEIACLKYTSPRLTGRGAELSRLGGGIGTRGPGESQLETDRRHLRRRIGALEAKLREVEKRRSVIRSGRSHSALKTAALVGYTNAGKSSLLNHLTKAGALAEDKLFATLDPMTRRLHLPSGKDMLLTDTVGFISRLPHHLVDAFRSTLEEVKYADIIVLLTDASEPDDIRLKKLEVSQKLLDQLGAGMKPEVKVCNKCDAAAPDSLPGPDFVMISARTGEGIDELLKKLDEKLEEITTEKRHAERN